MLRFQVGDIDGKFKITFFINEVLDKLLFHAAWSFHTLFDKVEAPFRVEVVDSAPTVKNENPAVSIDMHSSMGIIVEAILTD